MLRLKFHLAYPIFKKGLIEVCFTIFKFHIILKRAHISLLCSYLVNINVGGANHNF